MTARLPDTVPPPDVEDRDPGLARERTDLAWTRTAISFAALGAAMLRVSLTGLLVMAAAAAIWGIGRLSAPPGSAGRGRWRLPRHLVPPTVTAATLLTALLALVLAALV